MVNCFRCIQLFGPYGLYPAQLLCPWSSSSKNTGIVCHALPQGIFLTQESHMGLLHCRQILYCLSYQGSGNTAIVQFSSVAQSCPTLCDPMNRSTPGLPVHHQLLELLKLMPIESVMPSSHLILCCSLLLLPSIPPSIRVFSNEPTLHMRWPKYWSFSFSISPSNEHPGLISFRMDWLDLLAVQGTLKSLLQHHSSKA